MANDNDYLRPEAGPVPYKKLQWRAQKALDKIIGALNAATRNRKVPSDDASLDTNPASRLFFVSGEPGSGKSTLYLTLKKMLSETEDSDKYSEGCKNIGDLKKSVRWLDPLDLEVADDEGENLLAAVLVRLIEDLTKQGADSNAILSNPCEGAIKDLEELATGIGIAWEGNLQARAGHLDPDTFSEEVMRTQRERLGVNQRLRKVLNDLANGKCYGCSNNTLFVLPVDDFYLKPNASLQLLRLLRMISVPRLFFLVMGDITTIEALFIEKSLSDWTKVAGAEIFAALPRERRDEALARARELRARYLRKLLPPLQREKLEVMDWDEALKFKPEQLEVKDTLEQLLKEEKLDKRWGEKNPDIPLGRNGNNNNINDDYPSTLLEFLLCPPFNTEAKSEKEVEKSDPREEPSSEELASEKQSRQVKKEKARKAREAYTALQILDATPREIMDFWFALHNPRTQEKNRPGDPYPPPALLLLVAEFVELVIEEQNFLTEEEQTNLRDGVLPSRHYSARDIQFGMDRLSLEPDPNTWENPTQIGQDEAPTQVGENQESQNQSETELWVRPHRSWKLAPKTNIDESEEEAGLFAKLPPRQTAWIILLHDLACEWKAESVTGNLVKEMLGRLHKWSESKSKLNSQWKSDNNTEVKDLKFHHLVKLRARRKEHNVPEEYTKLDPLKDFQGWAVRIRKIGSETTYEHFPKPNFETFRDLDRFLFVWSTGFEWLHELWKLANKAENENQDAQKRAKHAENEAKEAEATAAQKRAIANEAKGQVEGGNVEDIVEEAEAKEAEAVAIKKWAKANETKAELVEKQTAAEEAKEKVGGEEWIRKYIDLWGLAGWIVINDDEKEKKYEDFARRQLGWFEEQLATYKNVSEINEQNKNSEWLIKIKDFYNGTP